MLVLSLGACAEAEESTPDAAAEAADAAEATIEALHVPLQPDAACLEADHAAAMAHLVAAGVVRAAVSLGESGARWEDALRRLAGAQVACLDAAAAASKPPTAPARALRAAVLRDVKLPREDRGGIPLLPWRLLDDGGLRAARQLPAVDAALEEGRLSDAHAALVAAQRARLVDLPEILRFLDEADRTTLLADPAWIGWLGVRR